MKKIFLILFILQFLLISFSQDDTKDYSAQDWINKGDKYYVNNKIFEAIECYTKAIEINPDIAEAYYRRGKANQYFKYHQDAINDFVKAAELDEKYKNLLLGFSNDYNRKRDYFIALLYINKAIELQPDNSELYYARSTIQTVRNEIEKALEDINISIKLNPKYAEAYNYRASIYDVKKDYEKAIIDYNKAIELNPNIDHYYFNRGLLYNKQKLYDKAIIEYNKALVIESSYYTYFHRGIVFLNKGEYEKALNDFKISSELDKKYYYSFTYYGLSLIYTGNQKEALKILDKAIKLDPKSDEAFVNKGLAYYFLKDFKNSLKNFEEAINLNSRFSFTYFLHLISSYKISVSNFTKSKDLLNKGKLNPGYDNILLYSIADYLENNKTGENLINEAGNDNLKLCSVYCAIGYKYLFENDKAKAKEFFQKCLDLKVFEFNGYKLVEIELSWL